jgi:hypothetical protein
VVLGAGAGRLPGARQAATRWSAARRRIVEQAYGQWLAFLDRNGVLDPSQAPVERASDARLSEFVTELRARVAPESAAMMLGALVRMLSALEPNRDWGPLARVYNHLRQTAARSRDKLSRLVRPLPRRPHHRASDLVPDADQESCEPGDRPAPDVRRLRLLPEAHRRGDQVRETLSCRHPGGAEAVHRGLASAAPPDAPIIWNGQGPDRQHRGSPLARALRSAHAQRSARRSNRAPGMPSARGSGRTCFGIVP